MKLVPLGDKIVLKQCRSRRDNKVRYRFTGSGKGETAGGRGHCRWTWWNGRRKRSDNAGQ